MLTKDNIQDIFSKIYYINLLKASAKKEFFLDQVKPTLLHNKCEKMEAVDGTTIDINNISADLITDYARSNITSKVQKTYGISLTYGSLGCALSHKKIWDECAAADKPYLIFEDDIIPIPKFDNIFIDTYNAMSLINYDILLLGYNKIPGFTRLPVNQYISKPSGLITGLYSYILTNSGAKKMKHIFPLNKQIDSSISDNIKHFSIYCSSKPLFNVSIKFGSKTQQANSCINTVQKTDPNWNKLFM